MALINSRSVGTGINHKYSMEKSKTKGGEGLSYLTIRCDRSMGAALRVTHGLGERCR